MRKYYYHLTAKTNLQSILNDGLKANEDGDIFVFVNGTIYNPNGVEIDFETRKVKEGVTMQTVADEICRNQIFQRNECVLIKIDSRGIEKELIEDKVAEIPSYLHKQFIAKQNVISSKWLSFKYFKPRQPKMLEVQREYELKRRNK